MQQIGDRSQPRSAVTTPPKGWLEPANLVRSVPILCTHKLIANDSDNNPHLFQKTCREDYEIFSHEDVVEQVWEAVSQPYGSALVDNGISCMCVCYHAIEKTAVLVDPHNKRQARVVKVTVDNVKELTKRGAMVMVLKRENFPRLA